MNSTDTHSNGDGRGQSYYQQSPLLAETAIVRYNNKNGDTVPRTKVETKTHHVTGLQHPYDNVRYFLSRFPLGFRGCYNCDSEDNINTRDCDLAKSGSFNKSEFFAEMWVHKHHTKKVDFSRLRIFSHQLGNINITYQQYDQSTTQNSQRNINDRDLSWY